MRKRNLIFPFAAVLFLLVVLIDVGAGQLITGDVHVDDSAAPDAGQPSVQDVKGADGPTVLTLTALALLDGLLLVAIALMGIGSLSSSVVAKVNGPTTVVSSVVAIVLAIVMALAAIALLTLMLGLLFAVPFGTLIYMAVFGSFAQSSALAVLSVTLGLRLTGAVLLWLWEPRVLKAKALVLLFLTCVGCSVVAAFAFGLVPGVFVSIIDAIAAIVICIVAAVWALVLAIFGLVATVKSLT